MKGISMSAYSRVGTGFFVGTGEGEIRPSDSFELVEEESGDGGNRLDSPDEDDEEVDDTERVEGDCSGKR